MPGYAFYLSSLLGLPAYYKVRKMRVLGVRLSPLVGIVYNRRLRPSLAM